MNNNKEKLEQIIKNLDKLSRIISKHLEIYVEFSGEIKECKGNYSLKIESQDITEQMGAFGKTLEKCTIINFSSGFSNYGENETYWMTIDFRYTFKTRGSNGNTIMNVTYVFNENKWLIG